VINRGEAAMIYDTLKLSKSLREHGNFTQEQAEALAEALNQAAQDNLATKGDLSELKAELLKWMLGAMGIQTIAIIGAVLAIVRGGTH
jgi:hypothetical protein